MNDQTPHHDSAPATPAAAHSDKQRVYEQSGCYPAEGKPFRLWALLGWLTLVIVCLAVTAALLNIYFLGAPWKAA
jgi:hypothetical protein